MLTLNYFASIREATGRSQDELKIPDSVANVRQLVDFLVSQDPSALSLLADESRVLVAVNQTIVDRNHPLAGSEEVAFFPPMTGG
ncbi:MAG: molybdopterin converting factor subunit 1 [Gammaproteobacteria bacterium]|nr:molybdopterin converting factor subunit 1 [Gammaproteobacteria bacterium]